jgi:hypothetical protein
MDFLVTNKKIFDSSKNIAFYRVRLTRKVGSRINEDLEEVLPRPYSSTKEIYGCN